MKADEAPLLPAGRLDAKYGSVGACATSATSAVTTTNPTPAATRRGSHASATPIAARWRARQRRRLQPGERMLGPKFIAVDKVVAPKPSAARASAAARGACPAARSCRRAGRREQPEHDRQRLDHRRLCRRCAGRAEIRRSGDGSHGVSARAAAASRADGRTPGRARAAPAAGTAGRSATAATARSRRAEPSEPALAQRMPAHDRAAPCERQREQRAGHGAAHVQQRSRVSDGTRRGTKFCIASIEYDSSAATPSASSSAMRASSPAAPRR